MTQQDIFTSVWSRATRKFPELVQQWGAEVPYERQQAALAHVNRLYDQKISSNVQEAATRRQPPAEEFYVDPSTLKDPSYWGWKNWRDRLSDIGKGLTSVASPAASAITLAKAAPDIWRNFRDADEEASPLQTALGVAAETPVLKGIQAYEEVMSPIRGAVAPYVLGEPGVKRRYDMLREQGFGHIESLSASYLQTVEAGEIPLWKQTLFELGTDPAEVIPGYGLYGAASKAITKPISAGARAATRAAGRQAAEEIGETTAKQVDPSIVRQQGVEFYDTGTGELLDIGEIADRVVYNQPVFPEVGTPVQTVVPDTGMQATFIEEAPIAPGIATGEDITTAAPTTFIGAEEQAQRTLGQMGLGDVAPTGFPTGTLPSGIPAEELLARQSRQALEEQAERIARGQEVKFSEEFKGGQPWDVADPAFKPVEQTQYDFQVNLEKYKGNQPWDKVNSMGRIVGKSPNLPTNMMDLWDNVGKDSVNRADPHQYDNLVKTNEGWDKVNRLVTYNQKSQSDIPAYKSARGKALNFLAREMFGDERIRGRTGKVQERILNENRKKVSEYIESLSSAQKSMEMEDLSAQTAFGFKNNKFVGAGKPLNDRWLQEFFTPDAEGNIVSRSVKRSTEEGSPQNTGLNAQTRQADAALQRHMHDETTRPGKPHQQIVKEGGKVSPWLEDIDFSTAGAKLTDESVTSFREMLTPLEQSSFEGKTAWFKFGKKNKTEAAYKGALRRYFGATRTHSKTVNTFIDQGTKELEALGLVKQGNITEEAFGTFDSPGPIRMLYRALYNPAEWLPVLQRDHPDLVTHYWNLRSITDFETEFRKLQPDVQLLKDDNYFYRGLRLPDKLQTDHNKIYALKENLELGSQPSIWKSRKRQTVQKTDAAGNPVKGETMDIVIPYEELERAGYQPLFVNPYKQAGFSTTQGLQHRLQLNLIDVLKDPHVSGAKMVTKQLTKVGAGFGPEHTDALNNGWIEVGNDLGPAFKGEVIQGTLKKYDNLPEGTTVPQETVQQVWMFKEPVANAIREMFGPSPIATRIMKRDFSLGRLGKMKPDDLIYYPKRIKLFGSLFQQVDFSLRTVAYQHGHAVDQLFEGMKLLSKADSQGFRELVGAGKSHGRTYQALFQIYRANLSAGHRARLKAKLISDEPVKGMEEYTWKGLSENGLNVGDETIFGADDMVELSNEVVATSEKFKTGAKKWTGYNLVARANKLMSEGLFDGVYPAAIMFDVEHNILPMVVKAHPDFNPQQVMGTVAELANIKWSTIPREQSVMKGFARNVLERSLFSLNEFESIGRMTTGAVRGSQAAYWRKMWLGVILGTTMMANLIHFVTTSLTKVEDGKLKFDLKLGRGIPLNRYNPIHFRGWYTLGYGYNTSFLSPDIPIPTRSGDRALLDLIMQMDFLPRLMDGAYGYPAIGFFNARLGTTPRAVMGAVTGKNYMGTETDKWGFAQRSAQFIYDMFAPIGAGQLAIHIAGRAFKESKVPEVGMGFINPGATVGDILPSVEARLGDQGISLQSMGLNLKSVPNNDIKDQMVKRVFGDGYYGLEGFKEGETLNSWNDLKKHRMNDILASVVFRDERNAKHVKELALRQEEGAEQFYDDYGKYLFARKNMALLRQKKEVELVKEETVMLRDPNSTTAWSPTRFRARLKALNKDISSQIAGIERTYKQIPLVVREMSGQKPASRAEDPLGWAQARYRDMREEHVDPITGDLDYGKFEAAWEKETSQWDDAETIETGGLLELFNQWLNQGVHDPFVQEYYDALGSLKEAGYWQDTPEREMSFVERNNPAARQIWDRYITSPAEERRRLRASLVPGVGNAIRILEKGRKAHRYNTVINNPELDRLLIKWFANTPHLYENRMYYYELYGKLPGSIRSNPYR